MGISIIPALFLIRHRETAGRARRGLVLGRQTLNMNARRMKRFLKECRKLGLPLSEAQVRQEDGFTETLFATLGYPPVEALDFTASEGAQHVHDLNLAPPAHLKGKFDLVIDGGTTEHVFHIGRALDTCHMLLKPGGIMMSWVACDGWFGHGFYQVGPDIPWRYWHHTRGYEMLEVSVANRKAPAATIPIPDPTGRPRGGEHYFNGPHMLLYACRRPMTDPPYAAPVQGHYVKGSHAGEEEQKPQPG